MSPLTVLTPEPFEVHEPGSLEHSIGVGSRAGSALLVVGRWYPGEGDFQGMPVIGRKRAELYAEALNTAEGVYIDWAAAQVIDAEDATALEAIEASA